MRQFDNYNSYLDNLGLPLVGKVVFCDSIGVESNVCDSNGVVLGSTIFTTSSGRLSKQAFLYNHDYVVKFYKYVGNTSMNDDVEDDSWELQYSSKNLYSTVDVNVDTVGIQGVQSIEDLRRLNPESVEEESGSRIVNLLGYISVGDKPGVSYSWDSTCTLDDNGGSIIQYSGINGSGRWVLVDDLRYVDVRHFGAFPTETAYANTAQRWSIQKAYIYASSRGKELYFHADQNSSGCYYDISGLNIQRISTSVLARLFCIDGSTSTVKLSGDAYFYGYFAGNLSGTIKVYGDTLKTSYNTTGEGSVVLKPSKCLILDYDYSTRNSFYDIDVVIDANQSKGHRLYNCRIFGSGKFVGGTNVFDNCNVYESLFGTGYDYIENCTFTNCKTTRGDWSSDDNYNDFVSNCTLYTSTYDINVLGDEIVEGHSYLLGGATIKKEVLFDCGTTTTGTSTFKQQANFESNITCTGSFVLNSLSVNNPITKNYSIYEQLVAVHDFCQPSIVEDSWLSGQKEVHIGCHFVKTPDSSKASLFIPDSNEIGKVVKISASRTKDEVSLDAKIMVSVNSVRGTSSKSEIYLYVDRGCLTFVNGNDGWFLDRYNQY